MHALFENVYQDRTVLVTGHTGFKGSWLALWLKEMGADVIGFSLPEPPTEPSHFELAGLGDQLVDGRGDIRQLAEVVETIERYRPSIVFHLAAQPIVFRSIQEPLLTYSSNTTGTLNLLEAVRHTESVRAVVSITTDKVYADQGWLWGYRENDRLGGHDPYSASKAMAELALASYRETYFAAEAYAEHGVAVASARAGNVIGGGDFADFRLVPDCMRALMGGQALEVRDPRNVRPWMLVLEPLSGYLWLGARLLLEGPKYAEAWNFGPAEQRGISAGELLDSLIKTWGEGRWQSVEHHLSAVEKAHVRLNWDKAAARLGWQPVYSWEEATREIVAWFRAFQEEQEIYQTSCRQIEKYVDQARQKGLPWAAGRGEGSP